MRVALSAAALLALAACEDPGTVSKAPSGPPIEITEAARTLDRTRVVMRYRNGGAIAADDELRAVQKGAEIACREGESPISDTRERADGLLTAYYFCVSVGASEEVIDGSGLKV